MLLPSIPSRSTRVARKVCAQQPCLLPSSRYCDYPRTRRCEIDKKPAPVNATDCPVPDRNYRHSRHRGLSRYRAYVGERGGKPLCVSRQPFLDSARKLIARGHDPQTMLVMRWAGAKNWALRSSLGAAAKLTVDEHNGTFAKWKPYSRSAAPPKIAKSVNAVPDRPGR